MHEKYPEGSGNTRIVGKQRFVIFVVCFALITIAVISRYGYLMLREPPESGAVERPGGRGSILDRNGRILALEVRTGNITLWRPAMKSAEDLSRELAPLLEQSQNEIYSRITNTRSDSIRLKQQVRESSVDDIAAAIKEGRLPGVGIEHVVGRIYPEKTLASQLIGFLNADYKAGGGVEYAFDEALSPDTSPRSPFGPQYPRSGDQVVLTIDVHVQSILETIAQQVLTENRAEAVMFMAMDPRTGDILGAASLPNFDLNNVGNSTETSRMDRPTVWAYEPGSVFKIFSLAALLETKAIAPNTYFTCNGYYERITAQGERVIIRCLSPHGRVSAREILLYSCNSGAAYAADQLASQTFYDQLQNLGFGKRTGAGNTGETVGIFRSPEQWSGRSKPTIAFGQEISVSALQMLKAATAIANDGILVSPRIVLHTISPREQPPVPFIPEPPRRVLSVETSRRIRNYMAETASDLGTGFRANVGDLPLGVKTGTAQMRDPRTGAYSSKDYVASTLAMLPAENPSLVLYLVIVKPYGDETFGGRIAAPPIREAAEALINYLGIPRGRNPQITHSGTIFIPPLPIPEVGEFMPDFSGTAKRQLTSLLLRDDLMVQIRGDGWVVRQSPAPGTRITSDTVIILELE